MLHARIGAKMRELWHVKVCIKYRVRDKKVNPRWIQIWISADYEVRRRSTVHRSSCTLEMREEAGAAREMRKLAGARSPAWSVRSLP